MPAKIILNSEDVKKEMYNCKTMKELASKFNCKRDFMSNYLLQYDLYNEFCLSHNLIPKRQKQYCCICGSDNQVERHKGKPYCKKHINHIYRYNKIIDKTIRDKNDYIFEENIIKIVLRDKYQNINGYCVIDVEDFDKVKEYKWYLSYGYCKTKGIIKSNGIAIHNIIMDNLNSIDVILYDHIDKDKLNNRKNNIRLASNQENAMNMSKKKTNTSGVTGVRKYTQDSILKWDATITYKYKNIFLGRFINFDEAVICRLKGEVKYFKEYSPNYNKDTGNIFLIYKSQEDKSMKQIEISLTGEILLNGLF